MVADLGAEGAGGAAGTVECARREGWFVFDRATAAKVVLKPYQRGVGAARTRSRSAASTRHRLGDEMRGIPVRGRGEDRVNRVERRRGAQQENTDLVRKWKVGAIKYETCNKFIEE